VRLLLDTAIVVWAAVWEMRLKWHSVQISGTPKGRLDPGAIVAFAEAIGWEFLPLTARHAAAVLRHPIDYADPFDELLLAQAQEESMRLLTRDAKVMGHPLSIAAV
jgi:PIN domain nuclease of toxin-antitoxin system